MNRNGLSKYVAIMRIDGVGKPLISTLTGCLPIGFQSLALLLSVRQALGGFGQGGMTVACYGVSNGVGMLLQGWAIDRYGPRLVLRRLGMLNFAALFAFVALIGHHCSLFLLFSMAMLAGLSFPELNLCMRALWPQLVEDEVRRQTAYALSGVFFEASVILGPLAFSLLLVLTHTAKYAILASAILTLASTLLFTAGAPVRNWATVDSHSCEWSGLRGIWILVFVSGAQAITYGFTYVCAIAFAVDRADSSFSGVFRAVLSVGAVTGLILYGYVTWKRSPETRLVLQLSGLSAVTCLCAFARTVVELAPLLLIFGAVLSPVMLITSTLVDHLHSKSGTAGTYSFILTASIAGGNIGIAAGATLSDRIGTHWTLLVACCWTGLAAIVAGVFVPAGRSLPSNERTEVVDLQS